MSADDVSTERHVAATLATARRRLENAVQTDEREQVKGEIVKARNEQSRLWTRLALTRPSVALRRGLGAPPTLEALKKNLAGGCVL